MSDVAIVRFENLSPRFARAVPRVPVGDLRQGEPRVIAGVFILVMALMFWLVGCTVSLQAYVLTLLIVVMQMYLSYEINALQAFVAMATITAVMFLIPQDLSGCLSVAEVKIVLRNCVLYRKVAEPFLETLEEIQIANLNKTTSWVALDNIKSLFK